MASIYKTAIEEKLLELFDSQLGPKGFRAVDVDCRIGGRSLVRFYIEKREGGAPVSLEDCAEVSRTLDPVLEGVDLTEGPYDLEVSSPGLDRRLRLRPDFERAVGQEVRLKLCEKKPPFGQNLVGTLVRLEPGGVVLSISKQEAAVELKEICRANLVWREQSVRKP